jgi:hypothetical protein
MEDMSVGETLNEYLLFIIVNVAVSIVIIFK